MKIRPVNFETDLPCIAGNYSFYEGNKAILVDEVHSWLDNSSPGRIAQMFVAVDENNSIQGHVEISHEAWHIAGRLIVFILVDPRFRNKRIGSALWDKSVDFLHGYSPDQPDQFSPPVITHPAWRLHSGVVLQSSGTDLPRIWI